MRFDIVSLTAGFAATASAQCYGNYFSFYNRNGPAMSYQRLDPGLFPGVESPHLHSFDGGNGLKQTVDYAGLQDSSCSTARVKSDKSLYWRPTLFFKSDAGFQRVPEKATKIYYKYGDGNNWANVTAYPKGFNMVAGKPNRRSNSDDNAAGVRWGCHQPDGGETAIFDNGFPKGFTSCKFGFASEVTYPSCWNGQPMDPKDGYAHMAYPNGNSGVGIENCPVTHRAARFPTLFIEYWWDISSFKFGPDEAPWVLSNGDATGYGFHADFMNGWDEGVLDKAISENDGCKCGCGCGQEQMEQCFGSANVNKDSDDSWASCSAAESRMAYDSEILDVLPGCNPVQYGPASATPASGAGCNAAPAAPTSNKSTQASSPAATQTPSSNTSAPAEYKPTSKASPAVTPDATPEATSSPSLYPSYPAGLPNKGGDCKPPVTVTYTPTVTVTATAANVADASICTGAPTVYKTLTETVTVQASGSKETPASY
ncbi:hypothetical protein COCC4DRAFT_184036 [Bipolaris maydis ATCC 48331]|uniref:DUF1996 domain-containing protein n=1 Tax=Cochliobolus heterostrophus (strain C4 / ATCC 48331 / race T) TaxID=665024 RepID=N4XGH2_COCH4|nr:uncharacterized protein COCC4DRAFT_184036 [Bipolaris maydis ATCC 48331]ENI10855.1 hypothetical protein COCC4DRAFT_184036 [Bipolaris maydis ATCC 48331]